MFRLTRAIWISGLVLLLALTAGAPRARAAVACGLDHPDRDVKRLFRDATTYRVRELVPFRHGPKDLAATLARELNTELDAEYETRETPYTFYAVYKGKEYLGLILGVNARAVAGPMQIFVAYEKKGTIHDIFVQKISSPDATAFRSKYYRRQFYKYGINSSFTEADIKPPVRDPSNDTIRDHHTFVRAVRLNILLVKYLYNKFHE